MSFTTAGEKRGPILEAFLANSQFENKAGVMDVAIHVQDKITGESDWWRGELSAEYCQFGNRTNMRWADITLESLQKIGWQHGGNLTNQTLATLVGQEIQFTVKQKTSNATGKVYNVVQYIGGSNFTPDKVNDADAAARVAALFGPSAQAGAPAQPAYQVAPPSPQFSNAGAAQPQQAHYAPAHPVANVPANAVPVQPVAPGNPF